MGVSCASGTLCLSAGYATIEGSDGATTSCMAVGNYETAEVDVYTLAMTWNGRSWSLAKPLDPEEEATQINTLDDVSCTSATFCMATGYYFEEPEEVNLSLAEVWNGSTWEVIPPDGFGSRMLRADAHPARRRRFELERLRGGDASYRALRPSVRADSGAVARRWPARSRPAA